MEPNNSHQKITSNGYCVCSRHEVCRTPDTTHNLWRQLSFCTLHERYLQRLQIYSIKKSKEHTRLNRAIMANLRAKHLYLIPCQTRYCSNLGKWLKYSRRLSAPIPTCISDRVYQMRGKILNETKLIKVVLTFIVEVLQNKNSIVEHSASISCIVDVFI